VPPELAAALTALLVAACGFLASELRYRQARRERERERLELDDVRRKVGADRRVSDRADARSPSTGSPADDEGA
jgi:hypothetical protein